MALTAKMHNIHNVCRFRIVENEWPIDPLFIRPGRGFNYFRVRGEQTPSVDLEFEIGDFKPNNQNCVVLEDKYYVRQNYFYCKDHDKILKWEFEWQGIENAGPFKIRISKDFFGSMAIGTRLVDSVIRYKMNQMAYPMVHSLAVARGGASVVLSGRSGVGKTNSILNFLGKGFQVLGDNWIIVHKGKAMSFPLPMNIFVFNLLPILEGRLSTAHRWNLSVKNAIYRLSLGYVKKKTPIEIHKMFPGSIIDEVPIRSLLVLIQGDDFGVAPISKEQAIEHLIVNDKMDRIQFYNYLLAYASVFPKSEVASHWERLRCNLHAALPEEMEYFKMTIPRRYTEKTFEKIYAHVENLLRN